MPVSGDAPSFHRGTWGESHGIIFGANPRIGPPPAVLSILTYGGHGTVVRGYSASGVCEFGKQRGVSL